MLCKCLKCGYQWQSRKDKPVCCPACKRYDYDKPVVYKEQPKEKGEPALDALGKACKAAWRQ